MIGESAAPRQAKGAPERIDGLLSLLDGAGRSDGAGEGTLRSLATATLCDLAEALADLVRGARQRASIRLRAGDETLELGLERSGGAVLASLYATSPSVVVRAFERPVDVEAAARRLLVELAERAGPSSPFHEAERARAARPLALGLRSPGGSPDEPETVLIEASDDLTFAIGAELALRAAPTAAPAQGAVLRSELLPLLFRGRLRIHAGGLVRELPDVHVFLVAERLAELALAALDASLRMRPLWRKVEAGGAACGVRLVGATGAGTRDALAFSISPPRRRAGKIEGWTFPSLELGAFARAVVDFGRALVRSIVRRDRSQTQNLRLAELRSSLREIAETCRDLDRDDTLVNASPESYRAYATPPAAPLAPRPELAHARLRLVPKWTAAVPAIDLRSIFLCGDAFVVGSARELFCIDRREGTIPWTRPVPRGVSVLTPCGLARIDEGGQLLLVDVGGGETRWSVRLEPRVGGPVTGAVIGAAGLPRMLVVSEGRRQLAGVDLEAGEILWRYVAKRGSTFRLRRAGRLVVVSGNDQGLFALDVVSGEVVWRYRDRLRFATAASVCDDSLFAIAGDAAVVGTGGTRLYHLDPWSGRARWSADLPQHVKPVGSPLVARRTVLVLALGPRGSALVGLDRVTGSVVFEREVCRGAAAALVVDDVVILNAESGELVAIGANDGEVRYRHVFADVAEGDRPRRLDPVLRSGALFVPQNQVHVVRPNDGRLVGAVPTDLVADLLRVDEKCDVYVAEESGHIAAFSAAPRLALVKSP